MSTTSAPPTTPVPPLNLAANFAAVESEVLAEITAICKSGYYVLGPKVVAFEEALAAYCGTRYALGLSSGTDALLVALMALNVGPGFVVGVDEADVGNSGVAFNKQLQDGAGSEPCVQLALTAAVSSTIGVQPAALVPTLVSFSM